MASLALTGPSLSCPLLLAAPAKGVRRARGGKVLCSARNKEQDSFPPSQCSRSLLPSFFKANCEGGIEAFSELFPKYVNQDNQTASTTELLKQVQRLIATTTLGASLLMVASPAYAVTIVLPADWLQTFLTGVVIAFMYFLAIPLLLYYYLEQRWYKRKMAEAIFQFGLVFLFFPGMLLLAPFINFRRLPQDGAKEPWDEIRPS